MKKYLQLVLVLMMLLLIVACQNDTNEIGNGSKESEQLSPPENTEEMYEPGSETEPIDFPDYKEGVLYTTVNRGSIYEEIYTSRETIEAVQKGQPIPQGTVITLLMYSDDTLNNVFVMEKRDGGGAHYPEDLRNGDWEYQAFTPEGTLNDEQNINSCLSCHASLEESDYVNTLDEMREYELGNQSAFSNTGDYVSESSGVDNWNINVIPANQENSPDNKFASVHVGYEMENEEKVEKAHEILLTMYLKQH
ncbi:cytochrome P460 family protein [Bacillus sp. AK031]